MSIPFKTTDLQDIFSKLRTQIASTGSYELENELMSLRETYSTMLHYMVKGVDDPDAGNIYRNLVRKSHVIGQRAQRLQRLKEHPGEKYSLMQKSLSSSLSLQSLHSSLAKCCATLHDLQSNPNPRKSIQDHETLRLSEERQSQLLTLFNWVWTSDMWHSSDYEETKSMLTSETLGSYEKSLLVSALTLSLTEMFDDKKLMLLFDSYDREDANVRMRAVVGIVLILRLYDSYIDIFLSVKSRLSLLYDNERFVEDTYMVMMQLQYSKLTDLVSDKMRNDIIPTLIQSGKFKKTQYGLQEIDDYMTQNGENPEWHKGSKDDAAQQKIQEMAELQMEGADVYMSTFVHMKNGPFFHETGNWLMPFSVDHPSIMQVLRKLDPSSNIFGMFLLLLEHAPFCNNDKYSFAFMMDNIGKSGQEMIIQNLSEQGYTDISFTSPKADAARTEEVMRKIVEDLGARELIVADNIAKVSIIGAGMKVNSGVAAKMFRTLADGDINISMISTSDIRTSVVIPADEAERAVRLLHTAFGLDGTKVFQETQLSAEELAAKANKGR